MTKLKKLVVEPQSVFISYRRDNTQYFAHRIADRLRARGHDVFIDIDGLTGGAFESQIFAELAARPHFLLVVTPSTLERCKDNNRSLLCREIGRAFTLDKNVVPVLIQDAQFPTDPSALKGNLKKLSAMDYVRVYAEYFDAGIRNIERHLRRPRLETELQESLEKHMEIRRIRQNLIEELAEIERQRAELSGINEGLRLEMNALKDNIGGLESTNGATCPLCGQSIDEQHLTHVLGTLRNQGRERGDLFRANQRRAEELEKQLFDVRARFDMLDQEL